MPLRASSSRPASSSISGGASSPARKQAQILEAEGRREAAFRDAEAHERSAAAEAKATDVVSEAIANGEVASINYFIADKYLRALTEIAHSPNQKVLMFPIEATNVLGTLVGITEIVNATFDGTPSSTRGSRRDRPFRP